MAVLAEIARHEEDVAARSEMRKETAFLNDVTGALTEDADLVAVDLRSVENNFTAVGFEKPDDQAQQGGFAATARTNQNGRPAALDGKIGRMQRRRVGEPLAKIDNLDQRTHSL